MFKTWFAFVSDWCSSSDSWLLRNYARVPTQFRFTFRARVPICVCFGYELGCETRTRIGDCGFVGLWFFPRPDTGPKWIPFCLQSACDKEPCENEGTCQSGYTDKGYRCLCPPQWTSHDCDKGTTILLFSSNYYYFYSTANVSVTTGIKHLLSFCNIHISFKFYINNFKIPPRTLL